MTNPQRTPARKPSHLRAVPTPQPTQAQDPTPAQQPQEPVDLWPVIARIYSGLALVGFVAVIAAVWAL